MWLLISFLICNVATFSPLDWIKDKLDYEHCGSIWLQPNIDGNYINNTYIAYVYYYDCI